MKERKHEIGVSGAFARGLSLTASRRVAIAAVLCFLFVFLPSTPEAQPVNEANALETALANAYLYIASRTAWPEETTPRTSFVFCINRDHSLFDAFAKLLPTRKLRGMLIELRSYDESNAEAQQACNLIALSKDARVNKGIVEHVKGLAVLTISDEEDITEYGGIVYLAHEKRLEPPKIDFDALKASKLKIDAAVLDLSKKRWGM